MAAWFANLFMHSGYVMAWGAAGLLSAPIIIHLINRLRFRRVRFAAMEFLLKSQQQNRRRLLIEQLILLLLRILIVAAIIALIARLILSSGQLAMLGGSKVHHVVLLDDSGSMRNRWGETTAFQEGLSVVKKMVAEGSRRENTQIFTLLLLSDPEQPVYTERDINKDFVKELETTLENVQCTHGRLDLVAGLDSARQLLSQKRTQIKHVHLLSDFRRLDWLGQKAVGNAVKALEDADVTVNLVKTVPARHTNLAITDLSGDLQVAAAGVPVRLKVGVRNFGDQVAQNVRVGVWADEKRLPLSIVFDKIEADDEVFREKDIAFNVAGKHTIRMALEADALAEDNSRYLAIDIAPANPVLIVDGDPNQDEAFYVAAALAADPKITGFNPVIENVDYLRKHPLDQFRCIYLLNVAEVPPDGLVPLRRYVREGGGLAWFVGDAVASKTGFYRDILYDADAPSLFPVPLASAKRELVRSDDTSPGPDLRFASHPIFARTFEGQDNPFVEAVRIDTYLPVADDWERDDNVRKDGVSTIATLRNKQPLMFEHTYGKGRVITCLTSAGPRWNNWAPNPSYVTTFLDLQKHIARQDRTLKRRTVGTPILVSLDPSLYTEVVEVRSPDVGTERVTRLKAAPASEADSPGALETPRDEDSAEADDEEQASGADEDGGKEEPEAETAAPPEAIGDLRLEATFPYTDIPGIYKLKLLDQNQVAEERWYSYNFPIQESALELASDDEIRKTIGTDATVTVQDAGSVEWIEQGKEAGHEVRKWLLIGLVAFLLMEQAMAYRLSYHPRTATA